MSSTKRTKNKRKSRCITHLVFFFISLISLVLVPKSLLTSENKTEVLLSFSSTEESNLLLADSYIYSSLEEKEEYLDAMLKTFKKAEELPLIKEYGENASSIILEDYIYVTDPSLEANKMEFYLIKNVDFLYYSFPAHTALQLYEDIAFKVNGYYSSIYTLLLLPVLTMSIYGLAINLRKEQ